MVAAAVSRVALPPPVRWPRRDLARLAAAAWAPRGHQHLRAEIPQLQLQPPVVVGRTVQQSVADPLETMAQLTPSALPGTAKPLTRR